MGGVIGQLPAARGAEGKESAIQANKEMLFVKGLAKDIPWA
jgi:hypothetical protein